MEYKSRLLEQSYEKPRPQVLRTFLLIFKCWFSGEMWRNRLILSATLKTLLKDLNKTVHFQFIIL